MNNAQHEWFEELKEIFIFELGMPEEDADKESFESYRKYYEEGLTPEQASILSFEDEMAEEEKELSGVN